MNKSCISWKASKGAYRLFSNEKFKANAIHDSHHKETKDRIKGHSFVFSVQDTTYLAFDSHAKTKGLGSITKAYTKHKMGLIVHSTLMLSMGGLPLGLGAQQCWARPVREERIEEKSNRRYRTPIQDKESYKWLAAIKETITIVPEHTQMITLRDREADIFEFLWEAQSLGTLFVIRNRQDRKFICPETGKTKLQTRLDQLPTKHEISIEVPRKGDQKARVASIEIKYMFGQIPIRSAALYGSKNTKHKINDKIAIYVISAKEINNLQPKLKIIQWLYILRTP